MYCQTCGALDNGAVRCTSCGADNYGPNKPELPEAQVEAQARVVRSNKVQNTSSSSDAGNVGCAFILALIIVGAMWLFGAFDY